MAIPDNPTRVLLSQFAGFGSSGMYRKGMVGKRWIPAGLSITDHQGLLERLASLGFEMVKHFCLGFILRNDRLFVESKWREIIYCLGSRASASQLVPSCVSQAGKHLNTLLFRLGFWGLGFSFAKRFEGSRF